uniref:Non-structural protein 1 n=1 Tax=Cane toad influenza-like virus TaxID=2777031 RepID=A0A866W0C6_9ORTO|nr:nonstructural protein [Cane toad influenza-like virus]
MSENKSVNSTNVRAFVSTMALRAQESMDTSGTLAFLKMKESAEKSLKNEQPYAPRTWEEAIEEGERLTNYTSIRQAPTGVPLQLGSNFIWPIGENPCYLARCTSQEMFSIIDNGECRCLKMMNCGCFVKTVEMVESCIYTYFLLHCRNLELPAYCLRVPNEGSNVEKDARKILRKIRSGFTVSVDEGSALAFQRFKASTVVDPFWRRERSVIAEAEYLSAEFNKFQ